MKNGERIGGAYIVKRKMILLLLIAVLTVVGGRCGKSQFQFSNLKGGDLKYDSSKEDSSKEDDSEANNIKNKNIEKNNLNGDSLENNPQSADLANTNPKSGEELFAISKVSGSVIDFFDSGCKIMPTHFEEEIAYEAAPGCEDEEDSITISYDNNCVFQIAYANVQTGVIKYEAAKEEDIKKQTRLIVCGDYRNAQDSNKDTNKDTNKNNSIDNDNGNNDNKNTENILYAKRVFIYRNVR